MNGIIIIDKPSGWTSHDVVAKIRSAIKDKRVGHGGTLDPMATGVLPVFIGKATRAVGYLENADKEYIAGLRLGIETDTQDITGKIINTSEVNATHDDFESTLISFLGKQQQIPPMYSAIKINGKKLYELARQGIEVDRPAREIVIHRVDIIDSDNVTKTADNTELLHEKNDVNDHNVTDYSIRVICSKGTYIRTVCHDIGQVLGCGAAMTSLRRTMAGMFHINESHSLEDVVAAAASGSIDKYVLPVECLFSSYPSITLGEADTRKYMHGAQIRLPYIANGPHRFYDQQGIFLMFGHINDEVVSTLYRFA